MVLQTTSSTILRISLKKYSFFFQLSFHEGSHEFILVFGGCFLSSKMGASAQRSFHIGNNNQNLNKLHIYTEGLRLEKFNSRYKHNLRGLTLHWPEDLKKVAVIRKWMKTTNFLLMSFDFLHHKNSQISMILLKMLTFGMKVSKFIFRWGFEFRLRKMRNDIECQFFRKHHFSCFRCLKFKF